MKKWLLMVGFVMVNGGAAMKASQKIEEDANNVLLGTQWKKPGVKAFNTAIGDGALSNFETGQYNIALGSKAGSYLKEGFGNIYILAILAKE